jgi:radical SAM superfamily enzyme YgiQ (UPF0313 family)
MENKVLLLLAPGFRNTVSNPYISTPLLASFARLNGHACEHLDLNVGFFRDFVARELIQETLATVLRTGMTQKGVRLNRVDKDILDLTTNHILEQHATLLQSKNGRRALLILSEILTGLSWTEGVFQRPTFREFETIRQLVEMPVPILDHYIARVMDCALQDRDIGFVGISIPTGHQLIPSLKILRRLRRYYPEVKTLIGGACLSTVGPDIPSRFVSAFDEVDALVVGDGELALVDFVESTLSHRSLKGVPNLIWKDGSAVVKNPRSAPIAIDEIPTPAWDSECLSAFPKEFAMPIIVGKGCYWGQCTFCTFPGQFSFERGQHYSVRNPETFVEELTTLSTQFAQNKFLFITDSLPPKFAKVAGDAIINAISDGRIPGDLQWWSYVKIEKSFSRELMWHMAQSGCREITIGVENLVDRLLLQIKKGYTSDMVEPQIRAAHDAGIRVTMNVIWDLPSATKEEIELTVSRARSLEPYLDGLVFNQLSVEGGAPMGIEPEKHGFRTVSAEEYESYWSGRARRPGIDSDHICVIPTSGIATEVYQEFVSNIGEYTDRFRRRLVRLAEQRLNLPDCEDLYFKLNNEQTATKCSLAEQRQKTWLTVAMAMGQVDNNCLFGWEVFTCDLPLIPALLGSCRKDGYISYDTLWSVVQCFRPISVHAFNNLVIQLVRSYVIIGIETSQPESQSLNKTDRVWFC